MGNTVHVPLRPLPLCDLLSFSGPCDARSSSSRVPVDARSLLHLWKFSHEVDDTVSCSPIDWSIQPKFGRHDCYLLLHAKPNHIVSDDDDEHHHHRDDDNADQLKEKLSLHELLKSTKALTPRGVCNPFNFEGIAAGDHSINLYLLHGKRADDAVQAAAVARGVELKKKFHQDGPSLIPLCYSTSTPLESFFSLNDVKSSRDKRRTIHVYAELLEMRRRSAAPTRLKSGQGKTKRIRPRNDNTVPLLPNLGAVLSSSPLVDNGRSASQVDGVPKRPVRPSLAPLTLPIIPRPAIGDPPSKAAISAGVAKGDSRFASSEKAIKGNKLAHFDGICSEITDQLFLGSDTVARDRDLLKEHGITHVLNCAGAVCDNYFPDQFEYKTLYLTDGVTEDISCLLFDIIEWMDDVLKDDGKVYVHCQQGVSRSSAMMIGYLMWKNGWPFEKTQKVVKDIRGVSSPNAGFIFHLLTLEKRLGDSSDKRSRLYHIVPQSKWDLEYLVGKEVLSSAVDEFLKIGNESCYILHSPKCIYLWMGENTTEEKRSVADQTVRRLQRFECATTKVDRINGAGEEDITKFHSKIVDILSSTDQ